MFDDCLLSSHLSMMEELIFPGLVPKEKRSATTKTFELKPCGDHDRWVRRKRIAAENSFLVSKQRGPGTVKGVSDFCECVQSLIRGVINQNTNLFSEHLI